jgi:ribonuclease III
MDLYEQAFIHSSYRRENNLDTDNERLEFFGDAVLKLVFSEYLIERFPEEGEGVLTKYRSRLISDELLAQIASELDFKSKVKVGDSLSGKIPKSILGDALEAFIGAVYREVGYDEAKNFILKYWAKYIDKAIDDSVSKDYKSILQEKVQKSKNLQPEYKTLSKSGPDHDQIFEVGVYLEGKLLGKGKGHSKKKAGLKAAEEAVKAWD